MKKIAVLGCMIVTAGMIGFIIYRPQSPVANPLAGDPAFTKHHSSQSSQPQKQQPPTPTATSTSSTQTNATQQSTPIEIKALQPIAVTPTTITTGDGTVYPIREYKPAIAPNDPGANQWWVSATGLPAAWDRGYGNYQTTVAVIDTGFGLEHEDLAGRWATNIGEMGATTVQNPSKRNCSDRGLAISANCNLIDDNFDTIVDNESGSATRQNPSQLNCSDRGLVLDKSCNLVDDDADGYVDDTTGWDFANYDMSVQAGQTNPNGAGTMHGTMVSGTLAATGNNSKGIAGVNWSTKVLPIQALNDDEYGTTLTISRGILYAVARGADIISLSLGSDLEDTYVRQVIDYALSQGTLVVAATGNDGCDCISYPARYPEVLAVGATNAQSQPASFSNFGSSLDILAPGQGMTLPAWRSSNAVSSYVSGAAGTSFATPYVAGLLAQLKSLVPTASYQELIATLKESADKTELSLTLPRSDARGFGSARAGQATVRATTPSTTAVRHTLSPLDATGALNSARIYDCQGTLPTTELFELSRSNELRYTTDDVSKNSLTNSGWNARSLGYYCAGLPIDQPQSIHVINLLSETRGVQNPAKRQ